MLRRDIEHCRKTGIEGLDLARHNIREWVGCGVVRSLKIYSLGDDDVCEFCKQMNERVFPIETPEQIALAREAVDVSGAPKKFCEAEPVMRRKEGRAG